MSTPQSSPGRWINAPRMLRSRVRLRLIEPASKKPGILTQAQARDDGWYTVTKPGAARQMTVWAADDGPFERGWAVVLDPVALEANPAHEHVFDSRSMAIGPSAASS